MESERNKNYYTFIYLSIMKENEISSALLVFNYLSAISIIITEFHT